MNREKRKAALWCVCVLFNWAFEDRQNMIKVGML